MLPAILGLGGLTAKIIATAVIPRVVRAISQSFSTTRPAEPCPPPPVEGISSRPEPATTPVLSGVSGTRIRSRKWGYAGLWHHAPSGLDLATYRLYDAANKRWISRDPLGEGVDYNLYRYCGNNPISMVDPVGLDPIFNSDGVLVIDGHYSDVIVPNPKDLRFYEERWWWYYTELERVKLDKDMCKMEKWQREKELNKLLYIFNIFRHWSSSSGRAESIFSGPVSSDTLYKSPKSIPKPLDLSQAPSPLDLILGSLRDAFTAEWTGAPGTRWPEHPNYGTTIRSHHPPYPPSP